MDLTLNVEDYILNIRAGGIITHNGKILLHHNLNKDHYAILGGRMEIGESSEETVKREFKEELGKDVETKEYVATIENFFEIENKKYHEIMFIYKLEFVDDEDKKIEENLSNLEGKDYLKYEWIDIEKLDEYNLYPKILKKILKGKCKERHYINVDKK